FPEKNFMQGPGAIRGAGGVFGRASHLHRREIDTRGAFPGHLLEREHRPSAVARSEHAELAPLVHLEYVRLEQRVVGRAGEPYAVVGEDMHAELHVLRDLAALRVLEPAPEPLQRALQGKMRGRAGVIVRERYV